MRKYKISPDNPWNCDKKGIIIGLAIGRQKAIVGAGINSRNKVILTDWNREFCSSLGIVSATGHVMLPFCLGK